MPSDALTFWLAAAAMTVVALAFVLPRLIGRRARRAEVDRATLNAEIYRAELADLAAERDAGTLSAAEYQRARTELERRLLEDVPAVAPAPASGRIRGAGLAIALAFPLLAFGLYLAFGTPAAVGTVASDGVTAMEGASGEDFRSQLLAHLKDAPRDGRAWVALARLDMNADRFDDAARHYAQAIDVSQKIARDPDILCEYADALGMAQGGQLAGTPAELIERALAIAPDNGRALEMAGSAAYERRDFRAAARHWRALLAQVPAGTPAHVELSTAIERADKLGALTLPPAAGTAGAPGS